MKHTKDILIISSLFIGLAIALTCESSSKDNYGSGKCSWDTNLAYGKNYCRGSRKCQYCYGKGWNYNPYDSGIIKCSACNNTGDCSYCRGTGVCSKCGGRKYQY